MIVKSTTYATSRLRGVFVVLATTSLTLAAASQAHSAPQKPSRELTSLINATIKKSFSDTTIDEQQFSVHGRLTRIGVKKSARSAKVSCDVSMVVTAQPKNVMFAMLSNSGAVQTQNTPAAIEQGKRDCVVAVVESMMSDGVTDAIHLAAR